MSTVTAEIRLLGPPTLRLDGRPARLHSAKTLALLTYLSLEGDAVHSREKLADLLWGNSPEARARQSLRQALYSLRQTLGQDCLIVEREAVTWTPGSHLWIDARAFADQAAIDGRGKQDELETWRRAVGLYRGLLLEGAEPSDCPAYQEWLFFQRDHLEQRLAGLLQALVDVLLERDVYPEALAHGQRLMALNPLYEGAHRGLMRVYAAQGDLDGVRRQYLSCRTTLERELGVEPGQETQALYDRLRFAQPVSPPARVAPAASPVADRPPTLPFMGRDRELETLREQLAPVLRGQGRLVLVAGEAGAGKTKLVESFLHACSDQVQVLSGQCYAPESHAPYAVWADALQELGHPARQPDLAGLDPAWRQQVARLVPALGPAAQEIEGATPAESRLRLLQGIVQALAHLTLRQPTVVWLDDLHWADEASLELLHYVARHLPARPLLLLGAYRSGGASDNAALQRLRSSRQVAHTVRLEPLTLAQIRAMLRQTRIAAGAGLIQRLYRQSEGNPLYLVETLNTLYESGLVSRRPERRKPDGSSAATLWTVTLDESWPVPERVLDLLRARMLSLHEEQRRVLAAAAVIGRPFGLRLLRLTSGLPEMQTIDAIDHVLRRGFLDERSGSPNRLPDEPALAFHHDYTERAIYTGLGTIQRRALHRRAADALVQLYRVHPQSVVEEIAYHYERAGDPAAVTYLTQAAEQAQALYAYQRTVELCGRALEFLALREPAKDTPTLLGTRFDLLLMREAALDRQGLRAEQAADVAELKQLAQALGDVVRLAIAGIREAGYHSYTGRYDNARRAGERALALYREAGDAAGEGQALRELGFLSWTAEDYANALAYMREALALHRRQGDVEGEATALHNLAEVHRSLGSPQQSIAEYQTALELYWARQDHQRQGLTLYGLGTAYRQMGELDEAAQRYAQALKECETAGDRLMISRVRHALAGVHIRRGENVLALEQMRQALAASREIGYGPGIAYGLIVTSQLHTAAGRIDAARAHLEEALTWMRLTEDDPGRAEVEARLTSLEQGALPQVSLLPTQLGWIKGHVALAEGKVYCAFESPLAGCGPVADDG